MQSEESDPDADTGYQTIIKSYPDIVFFLFSFLSFYILFFLFLFFFSFSFSLFLLASMSEVFLARKNAIRVNDRDEVR